MVKHLIQRDVVDIKVSNDETATLFSSSAADPQMTLQSLAGKQLSFFRGEYYLFCEFKIHDGHIKNPCVYLDFGEGFGEDQDRRVYGKEISPNQWVFHLFCQSRVRNVRFDPTDAPVCFSFIWLFLVSERELMLAQATSAVGRMARGLVRGPERKISDRRSRTGARRHHETSLADLSRFFNFPLVQSLFDGLASLNPSDEGPALRMFAEDYVNRSYTAKDGRYYHEYAGLAEDPIGNLENTIRSIAFYLPQMHPIPENDRWWGRGFTEWNNVSKAVPQFVGHYQPRLPGELGFYDLRVPEIMKRQVELALLYGLYGFCFYYYWFSGKRLLEMPLNMFLENKKDANIPFCICWANENWTRRWDGFDDDVLMQQNHSAEDMIAVFRDIEKYILDDRYIRIGGKPLVLIYRPDLIPDVHAMMEIWRDEARKLGLQGLYLIAAKAFGMESAADLGLDGLYDFPPHGHTVPYGDHTVKWFDPAHKGHVLSYRDVVESAIERIKTTDDETFQGALVGWDTEARKPGRGEVLHGATPRDFRRWLEAVCLKLQDKADPEKRIVFINAWNEWAEGAHLEPDRRHGYGF